MNLPGSAATNTEPSKGDVRFSDHMRWLWPYVRPRLRQLCAVAGLAGILSIATTAQPYLTKVIVDDGLIARRLDYVLIGCAAIVGLAVLAALVGGLNRWLYIRVSGSILSELREGAYARLLMQPPVFFRKRAVGDLVTRLDGDVAEVQRFSTDTLLALVNASMVFSITLIVMLHLSPLLTLVAACALPLQLALRHWSRSRIRSTTAAVREQSSQVAHFLMETLGSAKGVQAAAAEEFEQQRLRALNQTLLSRVVSQQMVGFAVGTGSTLLSHLTTAAVFIVGGQQMLAGHVTVGTLIAFIAYLARGSGSALSMMNVYLAYQRAAVSLGRVRELSEHAREPVTRPGTHNGHTRLVHDIPRPSEVRFCELSYTPAGASAALFEHLNWTIPSGSKVYLRGDSGAGKTSLVDLLGRFVQPDSGEILLAGVPLDQHDLRALRRAIVVLECVPTLFHGTLLFNLRYGHPEVSEASVLDAAQRAGLDEVIASLPDGCQTVIGARGIGLSAGQCQRVAVARALLSQPAVLVLDEATNNLDEAAVRDLHTLVDSVFAGATQIIITHASSRVMGPGEHLRLHGGRLLPEATAVRAVAV